MRPYWGYTDVKFADLVGKTLVEVTGMEQGGCEIIFRTDDAEYIMWHIQDCCESVSIAEVHGDPNDLIGSPLVVAEEVTNADGPEPEYPDSYTWTFYKLATAKGWVDIRWLGESNGYYSESVYFQKVA